MKSLATDIEFAKQLAAELDAGDTGRIAVVEFSFDAYKQTEDLTAEAWAIITPFAMTETREAHDVWGSTVQLICTMLTKQASNGSPDWLEEKLTSFDMLLDLVKASPKTQGIEREVRYDPDQIQTRGTLVAQAELTFNIFD